MHSTPVPALARLADGAALPEALRGASIAIGNFDGFHLGHQQVVRRALEAARAQGCPALVLTFDPHPVRYFRPELPPFDLTTLAQRTRLFADFGVDATVVLPFNAALAGEDAQAFVAHWLVAAMGVSHVVTGWNFSFGKGRSGNVEVLKSLGAHYGFTTESVAAVTCGAAAVTSTRIRTALKQGAVAEATELLTRPFTIRGVVTHGDKRGRTIDFPTANLVLGDYQRPAYGVYAVRVRLPDGRIKEGVANLGIRPMFDPPKELLEVYIFDFHEEIYDQEIDVALMAYLRPEKWLDGLEALKAQIAQDCTEARALLAKP